MRASRSSVASLALRAAILQVVAGVGAASMLACQPKEGDGAAPRPEPPPTPASSPAASSLREPSPPTSSPAATSVATATPSSPPGPTSKPQPTASTAPKGAKCADPQHVCLKIGEDPPSGLKSHPGREPNGRTDCIPGPEIYSTCNGWRVFAGPVRQGDRCCYDYCQEPVPCGRAFMVGGIAGGALDGERRVADARGRSDWRVDLAVAPRPSAELAAAWLADAREEHAAIASFGRASLELLAAGAPADLVEATHRAALDEIEHARACFALARAFDPEGRDVGPGPLSMTGVALDPSLVGIAARAAAEACVGETLSALVVTRAAESCDDPAIAAIVGRIAADERAHAELAWRVAAWAIARGGAEARAAFEDAARASLEVRRGATCPIGPADAARGGRLTADAVAEVLEEGRRTVVEPCLAALLAATSAAAGLASRGAASDEARV